MKKLFLALAILMGSGYFVPNYAATVSDAPMCTYNDPCLYTGEARTSNSSNALTVNIVVKRNDKGQIVALIDGNLNDGHECFRTPTGDYYFTIGNLRYYFSM